MRRIHISKSDFALFHQDITSLEYEFFRNHDGAFKRMWNEQTRSFWLVFVDMFDHFIWNYGVMKDFPLKIDEVHRHVEEIISLITLFFIEGNASSAKTLITECVTVARNQHFIGTLDKASYGQNPFYIKGTREAFRKLFGMPRSKNTFMKVLCGLPVYIKFAGSVVTLLRRWLSADCLEDSVCVDAYLSQLTSIRASDKTSLEAIERALAREKRREETEKTSKKVSKRHFANEGTKLKALEWVDDSKTSSSIADELEEFVPTEKKSYRSEYRAAIQSVTEGVRNSLVESIAEVKRKEIELAREKGEDADLIIEEFKEDLAKRKPPGSSRKKKRKRGGGSDTAGEDEISCLMSLHKEVSSSDRYLEAIGAKRPQGSLLPPCITEVNDSDEEKDPFNKEKGKVDGENKEMKIEEASPTLPKVVEESSPPLVLEQTPICDRVMTVGKEEKDEQCSNTVMKDAQTSINIQPEDREKESNDASSLVTEEVKDIALQSLLEAVKEEEKKNTQVESNAEQLIKDSPVLTTNHQILSVGEESSIDSTQLLPEKTTNGHTDVITILSKERSKEMNVIHQLDKQTNGDISPINEELSDTTSLRNSSPLSSIQDSTEARTVSPVNSESSKRKLLHICSYCQKKEEVAKTFKRCVKCRGKPHPHYYCSKNCQINEWKAGHRLDHKDDNEY